MPLVNVRLTKDGVTTERKRALVQGITELLENVMHKDRQYTVVIIDEVDDENWGLHGDTVAERMKRKAAAAK